MTRLEAILVDASLELTVFWGMPEADLLRDAETHVLVLIDQKDPRHHSVMRKIGAEISMDPEFSRWTTCVLPRSDFKPAVRDEAARMRTPDHFPVVILCDGLASVASIPDLRARTSN